MTYLIVQISLCLLIAFLLGMLLGYLLCKICCGGKGKANNAATNDDMTAKTSSFVSSYVDDVDDTATISLDTNVDLDSDGYDIQTLEGIGPQTGDLLRGYGISTVGGLLRKLHTPASREQAAKDLNILVKPIHDWASMSDLLRVEGIDHQCAELAYMTGISTVLQLANSNAAELVAEMEVVNKAGKQTIAPTVPTIDEVNDWVTNAKNMSPVVTV